MKRGKTERETLELNGWKVGDILEGDEGYGPSRILITAIGDEKFLCRWDNQCEGVWEPSESGSTTLSCRDWKFIGSTADSNCVAAEGYSLLILLAEIREAVGDPRARLMQDELVTHVRKIVAAGHEMRRIINIPAASDHTEWATDAEMDEAVKEWENLLSYNVETRHP